MVAATFSTISMVISSKFLESTSLQLVSFRMTSKLFWVSIFFFVCFDVGFRPWVFSHGFREEDRQCSWDGSAMREERELRFEMREEIEKVCGRVAWKWNLYSVLMFWCCRGLILWICSCLIFCWCESDVNFLSFKFYGIMFLFKINSNLNTCDIWFLILFFFFKLINQIF